MPDSRLEIVADEFLTSIDHYDEVHIWVMNWRLELEIHKIYHVVSLYGTRKAQDSQKSA